MMVGGASGTAQRVEGEGGNLYSIWSDTVYFEKTPTYHPQP